MEVAIAMSIVVLAAFAPQSTASDLRADGHIETIVKEGGFRPRHVAPDARVYQVIREDPEKFAQPISDRMVLPSYDERRDESVLLFQRTLHAASLLQLLGQDEGVRLSVELFVAANQLERRELRRLGQRTVDATALVDADEEMFEYIGFVSRVKIQAIRQLAALESSAAVLYSLTVFDQTSGFGVEEALVDYYSKTRSVEALLQVLEKKGLRENVKRTAIQHLRELPKSAEQNERFQSFLEQGKRE